MFVNEAIDSTLEPGNLNAFETVYKEHFKALHCYAYTLLKDDHSAEEAVQNVFVRVWERKETIDVHTSLKAYLYKAVYFESLNMLKHEKVKSNYQTQSQHVMSSTTSSTKEHVYHRNLEEKVRQALSELPEQCRTVFQLSRFQELKYKEIASALNISEKTVENHIAKALKLLRIKLADFITLLAALIHFKNNLH